MGTIYNFDGFNTITSLKIKKEYGNLVKKRIKDFDYPMAIRFKRGKVILRNGSKMWCGYEDFLELMEWLKPYVDENNYVVISNDCSDNTDSFHYKAESSDNEINPNQEKK